MLILIAGVLQPDRSYTVYANSKQDTLDVLHGLFGVCSRSRGRGFTFFLSIATFHISTFSDGSLNSL